MGAQIALPVEVTEIGEIRVWSLTYPFLPPSKNVYDGWPPTWKSSAKRKWMKWTQNLAEELALPKGLEKVGMSARLVFPSAHRRDPQNYAQCLWHWVPDGLVKAGVLVDDNDGRIEIPENWGLEMVVDGRSHLSKTKRSRTVVSLAARVTDPDPFDLVPF